MGNGLKNQSPSEAMAHQYQVLQSFPLHRPDDGMDALFQSDFRSIAIGVRSVARKVHRINLVSPFWHMKPWRVVLRGG